MTDWDTTGALLTFVSNQNTDYGRAIEEAKRDLDVFKKAYMAAERDKSEAEEKFEKEKKALTDELNAFRVCRYIHWLDPQLTSSTQASENRERRVVALIDGDGAIFQPFLIAMGKEGGHIAALKLTEGITRYLAPNQFQLHVYVFHNKRGLSNTLKRFGHLEAAAKFDDFIVGFNQAAERFAIIDAGELKEGSDHKIRGIYVFYAPSRLSDADRHTAYLDDNISSPYTSKVFFGGCHDNGYV